MIFTVRTDCEVIIKFYNETNEKKLSSTRWQKFVIAITGTGYQVTFEHIKGKDNSLTDYLSRKLANFFCCDFVDERQELDLWLDLTSQIYQRN